MRITIVFLIAFAVIASACAKTEGVKPVNTGADGVAMKGYDPVAYFKEGRPVTGTGQFVFEFNGASWRFSSSENRDLFASDPLRYAPQFGGYCAWAVSHGYTAEVDPEAWKIVDGKLYLNYNREVLAMWEKDFESLIKKGAENWEKFKTEKPKPPAK